MMKINQKTIDLHVHSNKSDGTFTPKELVDYALEKGLSAFALTDHDTMDGVEEAILYARDKDLEVIPGIEFSTEYEGRDIHILGLYIPYDSKEFKHSMETFQASRIVRNQKMCDKLNEYGIPITYDSFIERFPDAVHTRAHYATYLLENHHVKSMSEAFDRYVGDYAPCYLPREKITPAQAISLILKVGGIPILAHPCLYHFNKEKLEKLIRELKDAGLVGIETIYSTHNASEERLIRHFAKEYHLLLSGGSDFHGATKKGLDLAVGYGSLSIPYELLTELKEYLKNNLQ